MTIGIDARFYGPVGKGLGRYTERLIQNLEHVVAAQAADRGMKDHGFVIFLRKENFDLYRPSSKRFRKVLADFPWYGFAEQLRFPKLIRRERIDLMHFPHFNVPVFTPCPFVVTIHDLILLRYPTRRASMLGPLLYRAKYLAYRLTIGLAVRRAKRIIAVSEYTKQDLMRTFKLPDEKIAVTYEAADPPRPQAPSTEHQAPSLGDHGIVKPYFLYVGNAYPHKNLERLLRVFRTLVDGGLRTQLVLVGKSDHFYDRLKAQAKKLDLLEHSDVVFYGFADDEELSALYRHARLYVFPSMLEGFGLPPLEAMQHGTPVLASDNSCLPEILGDAAMYFSPNNEKEMTEKMRDAFTNTEQLERFAERGRVHAQRFSWERCARETLKIYLNRSIDAA